MTFPPGDMAGASRVKVELLLLFLPSGTISISSGTASDILCSKAGEPGTSPWAGLSSTLSTLVLGTGEVFRPRAVELDCLPSDASEK